MNKGNSVGSFVYREIRTSHARVRENLKVYFAGAKCVCVTLFSESTKYKTLKDAEKAISLCIVLPLFIFVPLIIS